MATFKDNNGTQWDLTITLDTFKRVKSLMDVDLGALLEGDPPLQTRLQLDFILLLDVLFAVVNPQAEKMSITDVEFAASLGGDAAGEANQAFWRSLIDFFLKYGRTDVAKQIQKQLDMLNEMVEKLTAKTEAINVLEKAQMIIDQHSPDGNRFGKQSTNGPALSESTPAP